MKTLYFVLSFLTISLLSSFKTSEACEYAGSNIGYVKTQTQLALKENDLNKSKYFTYKAIKATYKLKEQLDECGCEQAAINIEESQYHLKKAAKESTTPGIKLLLTAAYDKLAASLEAIEKHHLHGNSEISKNFVINSLENREKIELPIFHLDNEAMQVIIDDSLIPFEESLQKVVDSVDCKSARAFAQRIFQNCEQALLQSDISERKKYYNLKTQEITANALRDLGNCDASYSK